MRGHYQITKETNSDDRLFILGLVLTFFGLSAIAEWVLTIGLLIFSLGVVVMSSPPERTKTGFRFFILGLETGGQRLSCLFNPTPIESEMKPRLEVS